MKLACVILAHRRPEQVARLVSALRHAQVSIYLHVDRRAPLKGFVQALRDTGNEEVHLLPRFPARWGGPEVLDATMAALRLGLTDRCTYFTLISGQDFPVRSADEIVSFFERAPSRSYVRHFPLPAPKWRFGGRDRIEFYSYNFLGRRETCIPRGVDTPFLNWKGRLLNEALRLRSSLQPPRRFPGYVRPVGGWLWWNLSREAAQYVVDFTDLHPDYRRYHEHSLSPDEIFFQSILVGTDFATQHEITNDCLRFMRWQSDSSHPEVLTAPDLSAIMKSEALFARKFDDGVDALVLERLSEMVAASEVRRRSCGAGDRLHAHPGHEA